MGALEDVIRATNGKRAGDGYVGKCVGHDDSHASLSFKASGDKMLFRCFTGCDYSRIVDGLKGHGITLTQSEDRGWETVYTIRGVDGQAVAQHIRVDKGGSKTYYWRGPNGEKVKLADIGLRVSDIPLYGAELLGITPGDAIITEGEGAADAVRKTGRLGLGTITGASSCPSPAVLAPLKGRSVFLWPDNDEPGRQHMRKISEALKALGIAHGWIQWKDAPPAGDAADYQGDIADLLPKVKRIRALWEGAKSALEEMDRYSAGDFSDRATTGLKDLDKRLRGGLRGGQVTLLGAPTGAGKTSLVQIVAVAAARQERGAVLFVSPEMSLESLAEREIIRQAGVDLWKRSPDFWDKQQKQECMDAHAYAAAKIYSEKLPILVLEELEITMDGIEAAARDAGKLALIVIDYAQYVAGDGSDDQRSRYLQVGAVAERSVELAIKLNVPVLIASQVNVSKEGNRRSYTFRESQILEHKAHTVLILDVQWVEENDVRKPERADIICTKNRGFMTFRLQVNYQPELYNITDYSEATSFTGAHLMLPGPTPR